MDFSRSQREDYTRGVDMKKKFISLKEIEPGILSAVINNHKKRNALSNEIKLEIEQIALDLRDKTDISVVILSGEKGNFSSGNDIKEKHAFGVGLDLADARKQNRLGLRMCNAWTNMPQITIASIEGVCIGGALSLALSCDFRYCSNNAYFHAPEVDLGIPYGWGTLPKLVSLVGPAKAKLIALACKKIYSNEILNWGLCENVSDDPFNNARSFAIELTKRPKIPQQMVKESINRLVNKSEVSLYEQDQVLLNTREE